MTTQITITLNDDVYQKADRFARLANRDIASVLADTIQSSIPHISEAAATLTPISLLSDADVLALTELQMEPAQDLQLSVLLVQLCCTGGNRQQAGLLTDIESPEERLRQRSELQLLMQTYQEGLLRKATALSEAVKRKLIKPLSE